MNKIVLPVIIFIIAGCQTLPKNLKQLQNKNSSIIGIEIKTRSPIRIFVNKPDTVYFIKIKEGDDMFEASKIIPSNFRKGKYIYLVNAKPGKYVAVASSYTKADMEYNTFYDMNVIKNMIIEVGTQEIVYGGKFLLDDNLKNLIMNIEKNGDKAQLHYYNLMKSFMDGNFYCGSLKNIEKSEKNTQEFLLESKKYFKDSDWMDIINEKLGIPVKKEENSSSDSNEKKEEEENKSEKEAPVNIP